MQSDTPYLAVAHLDDDSAFEHLRAYVSHENQGYTIDRLHINGEEHWDAPHGVMFTWVADGHLDVTIQKSCDDTGRALKSEDATSSQLGPGDVLVLDADHSAHVHGTARLLRITSQKQIHSQAAGVRRLADLPDQAGGCNVGENAFRRLQITWQADGQTSEQPDGDNVLGCHVVWIAEATSRTHYHPVPSQNGGMNQHELYLVLDPPFYGLHGEAKEAGVWTYPEPGNWERYDWTPLRPGDVCAIKAGVAHRAVDVLACVIALPGFKPNNDLYVDGAIARANSSAPYNPQFV